MCGSTRRRERNTPAIPSRGSPATRPNGARRPSASQRNVHKEALCCALFVGEALMLQVRAHDARVVRSVPIAARRPRAEIEPELHGLRRGLAGQPAEERDRFASVAHQSLVPCSPPHAARRRRIERVEDTSARLPAHERRRRSSEREVSWCVPRPRRGRPGPSRRCVPPAYPAQPRPAPRPTPVRAPPGSPNSQPRSRLVDGTGCPLASSCGVEQSGSSLGS